MTSYGEPRLMGDPRGNFVDDMTTTAALVLAIGLLSFIPGTIGLIGASAEDVDWDGADGVFPPILPLLANMTMALFGSVSVFLGFQYVVCRWGSKASALFGLGATLLAWFPFAVNIAAISFNAENENIAGGPLTIPPTSYDVSKGEITSIAIMAVIGFYGYAGTVIGALTFLHWKMYRCFAGYADTYTASYYRSRLGYYGGLTVMTGVVQLALGAYINDKFGDGILPEAISVGPFFILYPEMSMTVGACQTLMGIFILFRSTTAGVGPSTGNKDNGLFVFQCFAYFVFIVSVGLQVIGQVALNPSEAPGLFLTNVIGFCLFPIYLDAMAHTTPENVTKDMFSMTKSIGSGV